MKLHGTILQLNLSPKGEPEGVMLQTKSGPAQLNIHPPEIQHLEDTLKAGSGLDVEATLGRTQKPKGSTRTPRVISGAPPEMPKQSGAAALQHGALSFRFHEDHVFLKCGCAVTISCFPRGAKNNTRGACAPPFGSTYYASCGLVSPGGTVCRTH